MTFSIPFGEREAVIYELVNDKHYGMTLREATDMVDYAYVPWLGGLDESQIAYGIYYACKRNFNGGV